MAVHRAAAGAVEQALRAAGHRADRAVVVEHALSAERALLLVDARALDIAQEERIGAGDHALFGVRPH